MNSTETTTDPYGKCFISYRRSRIDEIERLADCLLCRGIPIWQDVKSLDEEHTSTELRQVLADPAIASSVLWITGDVAQSPTIQRIEAPTIVERALNDESFFAIPVAAGGIGYDEASKAAGEQITFTRLKDWNLRKVSDNATLKELRLIANRVLQRRLRAIINTLSQNDPLHIGLFCRKKPTANTHLALELDWTDYFYGRHACFEDWKQKLLPALEDTIDRIGQCIGVRRVVASGLPSIGAAFALGRELMVTRRIEASWLQFHPQSGETLWGLGEAPCDVPLTVRSYDQEVGADELAVLISINASVEHAWKASEPSLPEFRAVIDARLPECNNVHLTAGEAVEVANRITAEIRAAREKYRPSGSIHLFMAVPAGLAFLLGQLSNTLGPILVYEHQSDGCVGTYTSGPLLL